MQPCCSECRELIEQLRRENADLQRELENLKRGDKPANDQPYEDD